MMIEHIFAAGLILTQLLTATVPFTHNPDEDGPEYRQRVALNFREIPGLEIAFEAEERALVRVYGYVGFQLDRCLNRARRPRDTLGDRMMITLGFQLNRRWIDNGSKIGTNVDRDDHYHTVSFSWSEVVEPGRHEVRLMARSLDLDGGKCWAYFKPHQFSRMHVEVLERP